MAGPPGFTQPRVLGRHSHVLLAVVSAVAGDPYSFQCACAGAPAVGTEPAAGSLQDQPSLIQAENTLVSEAVLKLMDPIVQPSAPAALGANSAAAAASAEAANSEPEQPEFVSSSAVPAESAQHEGDSAAAADAPAAKGKLMLRKARLKVAGPVALGASSCLPWQQMEMLCLCATLADSR